MQYTLNLNDSLIKTDSSSLARNSTSNINEENRQTYNESHSLSVTIPQLYMINPFNKRYRIRLGAGSFSASLKKIYHKLKV